MNVNILLSILLTGWRNISCRLLFILKMGCGGSKRDESQAPVAIPAAAAQQPPLESQKTAPPPAAAAAKPPAPAAEPAAKPAAAPADDEETWPDSAFGLDADLDREINTKKVNKAGDEVDMYDRGESRPEDNLGMFSFEAAGSGDQALATKPWNGQIKAPDNEPTVQSGEPDINLELEYIYGYRCFDTRQNIFFRNPSEIVYMAAAVGIVLNTDSNTQKFFGAGYTKTADGHSDDITALAIAPDRKTIATGEVGKNPKICVWDSGTMEKLAEWRQGRGSRAVTTLAFNKDGSLLASCGLDNDHTVRIWKWQSKQQLTEQKGGPDKILDCCFSPTEDTLCTAGIKHIYFWFGAKNWDKKKGIFGKNEMCNMTTAQFLPDGKAITGATNGNLYIWDGNQCFKSFKAHDRAIHTLRVVGNEILSGGSDHKLNIINASNLQTINSLQMDSIPIAVDKCNGSIIVGLRNGSITKIDGKNQKNVMRSHCDGEVWGLDVHPTSPNLIISTGDDNKTMLWDVNNRLCLRTGTLDRTAGQARKAGYGASTLALTAPNQQARCIAINKANGHVAVAHNDGHINIRPSLDDLNNITNTLNDPKEWTECMRYSPDGSKLAVGSHDQHIYIYDANSYALLSKIWKHSSYLTALDWSNDSTALHSTCGSYELLYFKLEGDSIEQVPSGVEDYKNELWASFSTHFGWPVQGIFGGVIDYTHVNRVDRSPASEYFAVGNDWGLVEVFGNPNKEGSKSKGFRGHSEHVTNVKWSTDGKYLFSAGGYDQCIMQWKKV